MINSIKYYTVCYLNLGPTACCFYKQDLIMSKTNWNTQCLLNFNHKLSTFNLEKCIKKVNIFRSNESSRLIIA